jgi:hypothetical protein
MAPTNKLWYHINNPTTERTYIMNTEWRIVPGFERFSVTSDGRVRRNEMLITRLDRWGNAITYKWKIKYLKPRIDKSKGYPTVSVSTGKVRIPSYVHRLVALAFVEGFKPGYHVNHINGIKHDNRAENLEWVTLEENIKHAWRTGLVNLSGEDSPVCVLTWKKVEAIRRALSFGVNVNTIAIISDVSNKTIQRIKDGVSWRNVHVKD